MVNTSQGQHLSQASPVESSPAQPAQRTSEVRQTPKPEHSTSAPSPPRIEPDEVILIQRARQQASDDARAALRTLDEHARRFPHGMLSQERELLAIQLLRALSRDAEADKRAQAFRHDFPRSIYLSRIGGVGHRD